MERRSCSNVHFINAIKGSSVVKVCNVNSYGKPALTIKKLKDIYESLSSCTHTVLHPTSEFGCNEVKVENEYLPVVVRRLCEVETADIEALPCGSNGGMGSDLDDYTFGKMTLKELKRDCKAKKRKRVHAQSFNPIDNPKKLEGGEDDPDLKEPLISWKLKFPKAKRKCCGSPNSAILIKSESQDLESERPLQFQVGLHSSVHVKNEVTDSEIKGCQSVISDDYSFTVSQKDESGLVEVMSERNLSEVECQSSDSDVCVKGNQSCALNEVSYDHLNNVESPDMFPSCEEIMDIKGEEKWCQQFLELPISENGEDKNKSSLINDRSGGGNGCSKSCDLDDLSGHSISNPAVVVTPHTLANDCISIEEIYCAGDSLHLPDPSTTDAELSFSKDDESEEKQPSECSFIDRVHDNLINEIQLDVMEDDLSSSEERQPPISASIDADDAERDSIPCGQKFVFGETPSSSVAVQVPERLLSTRKVVSPTSEERFSLAMSSAGSCGDTERPDCKEDICNEKQTEIQSSCEESDKHKNVSKSPQASVAVSRMKFILSSSQIRRKGKHERTSPPKGNVEGPRSTRSLPKINDGCTSVEGCSESAIAFSRRQMQDIESLATKLMSELKSMKDMVEEKLLFEAYRNLSSKHDADEVKNAVTSASKAEEMAKKWLSMMGRDCNRFCKIMSLSQTGDIGVPSNNTVQRERKKITFADEAGGMLCHVKFFENGMTSPEPEV